MIDLTSDELKYTPSQTMDHQQRATVAFLCGNLTDKSGRRFASVYDYSTGTYVSCNFVNNSGNVSIYDYRRGCYLSGRMPSFYDYGLSSYISLTEINNNTYNIYDYHTGSYITVTCQSQLISIYDYSESRTFQYQIL